MAWCRLTLFRAPLCDAYFCRDLLFAQTRMFIELAKRSRLPREMFMYWCLRPRNGSGDPPRSTYFADRLEACTDDEQQQQERLSMYFLSVRRVAAYLAGQADGKQRFWQLSGLDQRDTVSWNEHQNSLRTEFPQLERAASDIDLAASPVRVVLCLDEASTLLRPRVPPETVGSFFRLVRKAAQTSNVQLVLADTQSKITNFVSAQSAPFLASARPDAGLDKSIPAPWIAFNVVDFDDFAKTRIPVGVRMGHQLDVSKALLLGRPLWFNSLRRLSGDLIQLREFATQKLLCSVDTQSALGSALSQEHALAILASRCVLPQWLRTWRRVSAPTSCATECLRSTFPSRSSQRLRQVSWIGSAAAGGYLKSLTRWCELGGKPRA